MVSKFEPKQFKHVLAAVDDSPQGQSALSFAIHQSQEDHAKLTILSVLEEDELPVTTRLDANEMNLLMLYRFDLEVDSFHWRPNESFRQFIFFKN